MVNGDANMCVDNASETKCKRNGKRKKNDIILRNILNIGKIKQKQQLEKNNNSFDFGERRSRSRIRRPNVNHQMNKSFKTKSDTRKSERACLSNSQQRQSPSDLLNRSQSVQNWNIKYKNNKNEDSHVDHEETHNIGDKDTGKN